MDDPPLQSPAAADAATTTTWSIADVERDTGLGKDTLRVWERRYGFPSPGRDANGERAYPPAQVERLRVIKRLLDAGRRPGQVVPLDDEALRALVRPSPASSAPAPAGGTRQAATGWLAWLASDQTLRLRKALQQHIRKHGLGDAVESVIAPLCGQVGEAWLAGQLSIYQEHLFTELVQATLRESMAALDADGPAPRRPRVLLTTTPGEQHALGLLMAECFFALEGCERLVLGVSTPVPDIAEGAQQLAVDVLALSFSVHASRRDVFDALGQLQSQLPAGVEVWVGGAGVARLRGLPEGVRVLRRAADVSQEIAQWRERRGVARRKG